MFIGFELIFSPTVVPTNAVNGLGLCEEAELEVQMFSFAQMFIRIPNI